MYRKQQQSDTVNDLTRRDFLGGTAGMTLIGAAGAFASTQETVQPKSGAEAPGKKAMKSRLILDTDIGTDVDDALALALCLASPEIELAGVTTVYADSLFRAKIAAKLLGLAGRDDVPVYAGTNDPLEAQRERFWGGHEGRGLLTEKEVQADAARFGIRTGAVEFLKAELASRKETYVAAVGAYTNVALSLKDGTANPRQILLMGGVYDHTHYGDMVDYNIECDVGAAREVCSSPHSLRLTTIDITLQTRFDRKDVERVRRCNTSFTDALAILMEIWLDRIGRPYAHLHDALAISPLIGGDFVEYQPARVSLDKRGFSKFELCAVDDTQTLVSTSVRGEEFREWFFDRICLFGWPE